MMLSHWFEASVARYGTRTAVEIDGVRFSYRQLADMAANPNGLAA